LHERIRQRERQPGGKRRHRDFAQCGPQVEPDLGQRPPQRPERREGGGNGPALLCQRLRVGRSQSRERRDDEERLGRCQQFRRAPPAAQQPPAGERAQPVRGQQHGEHQREHRAEPAEQDAEVTHPHHLHAHHGHTRQADAERGRRHQQRPVSGVVRRAAEGAAVSRH